MQQVVQSEALRLGFTENLLVIDSDCKFIRPFQASDSITPDGTPYSVLCSNQYVSELAARLHKPKIWTDWLEMSDRTREWAHEDSDLAIRAISFGLRVRRARSATCVLHLWHRERSRSDGGANWDRLLQVERERRTFALKTSLSSVTPKSQA